MSEQLAIELYRGEEPAASAWLSADGVYRYQLARRWGDGPTDVWIMLNPSTADAEKDDRTIGRCTEFSKRWGAGGLLVVNLYALRSTDPALLRTHPAPIGPDNANAIARAIRRARAEHGRIIAAWGASSEALLPGGELLHYLYGDELLCLGVTKSGQPRHPLYVRGDTPLRLLRECR